MYKSIIEKNRNRYDKIALLAKTKWNTINVLIYKALLDSDISHDEFVLVNNVLKKYNDMKEAFQISWK